MINSKKLVRLRRTLDALRLGLANMPSRKLENFARALGRRRAKRGSEPTWVSDSLPNRRPVSIPHHSRPLKKRTAENILDQLERDLIDLELIEQADQIRRDGHG